MTRSRLWLLVSRILRALWFRPALYAVAALAVLLVAPSVATLLPDGLMKVIGLQGVYDLLNALASTLLSVAIFSLGILAASLRSAAQGATPRVRPLLAEDSTARNAISTFIGGFVFAVVGIVILSTGYYSDAAKVLMFGITCVLILALIVALVRWIGRLSRLGGISESVDLAAKATRKALLDLAAEPFLRGTPMWSLPPHGMPLHPQVPGFVQAIDVTTLASLGEELDIDLHLLARPGALVGPGHPLLLVSRHLEEAEERRLREPFVLGQRRTFEAAPRARSRPPSTTQAQPLTSLPPRHASCASGAKQWLALTRRCITPGCMCAPSPWSTSSKMPFAGSHGTEPRPPRCRSGSSRACERS